MSGSRTSIIGENNTPGGSRMDTTKKNEKNATPKLRVTVPLPFKEKLIAEVKKHEIIWQDQGQKKNQDLVDAAWERVNKALYIKKAGFCAKHWKNLVSRYRNHINRKTPMEPNLIREMAFMTSEFKKSGKESESDANKPEPSARNKTPKSKKAAVRDETDRHEDRRASVAILELLFAKLPGDVMRPVRNSLIDVLIELMPDVDAKISVHAKQQVKMGGDINKLDWSGLDIPVEICKAVWAHKVMQMALNV